MKKRFIGIAIVSIALCLSGCGNSAGSSGSYSEETYDQVGNSYAAKEAAYDSYAEEAAVDAGGYMMEGDAADTDNEESALRAQDGQKIVYTGSLSIQTLEYDKSAASIRRKIREAGGFSEAESENDNDYNWYRRSTGPSSTRNLNITARIPSEKFESFMDSLQGDGKVMNRSMNAENISQVYANKETYKKALEKEQERLLAMMDKAVKTPTVTFPEKVKYAFEDAINSFTEFCEGIVLFIIRSFPFLILLAIVIALVIRLIRKRQEKRIAMMSDPEYAKMVSEKAKAKAKADAAKRDAREAKRQSRGGLFGKKKNDIVPSTHDVAEEKTDTKPDENSGE